MEFSTYRISFLWLLGLCLLLFKTGCTEAQGKRASRITSSRSFGTNVKSTSSNGLSFDCPEEFGYYPHPTDCTQYYVCVFGGALLESCTGGLMYSHELQTCDWPRNVGCELVDTSTERGPARSQSQTQQHHQQHVPSRVRFGSAFGSSGGAPKAPTVAPQYHRSPPQVIQAQVQHIPPPPPELRVPPNPVVTSRGQPKPLLDAQEDIAKLYAEAQETLPPVEEEESDRQQRVYRGQPSTVSQVQRDRDGIIHQASINAIPQSGKLGSYAFGTAYSESLDDEQTLEYELSQNRLEALDVDRRPRKRRDLTVQTTPVADTETQTPTEPEPKPEPNVQAEVPNDSNTSSEVMEPESPSPSAKPSSLLGNSESSNSSNNSQEHYDKAAPAVSKPQKYSSKISQPREKSGSAVIEFDYVNTGADGEKGDDGYGDDSPEDAATGESKRRPRQLRPVTHTSTKWTGPNYRAIDAPPPPHQGYQQHQTGQSYSFGSFNPYLTPPANPGHTQQPFGSHNYNQISPGYPAQAYLHQQQQISAPNQQKPKVVYTGYNLSLPPPPLEDDFRPIAGNYFRSPNGVPSSPRTPLPAQNLQQQQQQHSSPGNLLPYLIQQLKELKERRKHLQAENFAYFHLENQPITPGPSPGSTPPTPAAQTPFAYYSHSQVSSGDSSKPTQQVTPNGQFSTMGGFYNNQSPDQAPYTANYAGKLVSQYSIGSTTTESNYFQYNVIANQKMKGVYSTAKPNQIGHAAVKVRPPVTPLQVTQSINIVSAPNLAYSQPAPGLQQVPFRDFSHLPVGISYAGNSTVPESYQTFTKSITSEAPPTPTSPTTANNKPKLSNFQFNIHEFMANLKSSDLASVNPAINPLMKYFKQVSSDGNGNLRNAVVLRRPVPPSSSSNTGTTTTLSTSTPKTRLRPNPTISTPTIPTTTRPLKGYESFIKGIQNQINKQTSTHSASLHTTTTTPTPRIRPTIRTSSSTTTLESVDYYDEDYEEDEDILPPSHMPPYMPMSETMAPPRPQLVSTTAPVTESPGKIRGSFQTGFLEATTTRRPFPNFVQLNSRPSNETGAGAGGVPSFINFPSDIFQELKQRLPQLPESTTPTPGAPTPRSTRPSSTPASTSTRVRYTTRPRTRGQQKWMTMAPPASATAAAKGVENNTERAKNESSSASGYYFGKQSHSSIGGLQLNSIHAGGSGSGADRNRDIEYQQQQQDHQEQQQQQQQQPQQQQQYQQPAVRHQQTQSTYRPLELSATPTPPQKPQYSNQPTLTYSTDYDEDINAQIEQDNVYDQPTRSPQRPEQVAIQRLDARPTSTMTPPTRPDVRHYYDTLTTPNSGIGESDYSYSSSGEYAYNSSPGDYDQSEHTLMQVVTDAGRDTRGDYDLIANFVGHTQRKTTKPPSISGQNTQATPAISGSTTKGFTTQTVRAKKPTTTSTTTTSTRKTTSTTTPPPPTTTTTTTKPQRNHNRNRGGAIYANQDRDVVPTANRGTHPPRTRPTLKPSGTIVSKAQEFVDIYRYPPTRPDPIYPQPTPDKTAAKCRKDVCLLPDCYCGGRDIPGGLNVTEVPQIVLITFDDAINPINIDIYKELFNNKTRKNPNGCPWRATFYLSHEWTDYGMVQDMYSEGHEMASHTVSHSFGEQFSQKKWTREIAGQREILAAYGGVKLSDVRGMRAPFLSVGGNKMYKMLYDSNFTYDSSMPVYENRPPSWPYTLDYKIFHDCMIPPCPTRSYPGVWQVPMVMWQDLNGGRCSMGDACSNPSDAEGVTKMIMKNFERHYTTNRAPFGLFYHAAWFTQPHHKEGFIKFLDAINSMSDVWILTNWQALQWVRDPTPISRINSFQPFQCDYSDRPKRCNNPKVCNLWHKSGVRYMKTCQPCPDIYPWTGKSGIRSSRIDNDNVEEPAAA
ncbi:mucin-12 isoform X7 [Drosophila miranda]|uniref:mucin-12 isoform X7 n=1 Tax=Drosophila miranda TaxID=7229 RepID=UPI00143F5F87|nr:mucin-12 isoform X7 [Drosophila miranda]